MRVLSLIITVPIALIAVSFAVTNREAIALGLWPLPFTLTVPAFLAILLALVLGFLAGGVVMWVSQGRQRRRARMETARATRLEREVVTIKAEALAATARGQDLESQLAARSRSDAPVLERGGLVDDAPTASLPTLH